MPESTVLTLTNGKLAQLAMGLASLDGLRTKPDEFKPYKFDDENETTWLIANNAAVVADALKTFERAKKLLAVQYGIADRMQITAENAGAVSEFMAGLAQLEDKEVEVRGLAKISRARLKVGCGDKRNAIPPSVLAHLMPILEEE